jgi:glucose-fructose oxidoreductase
MSTQRSSHSNNEGRTNGRVRYAVVGLGHIAQAAVLPAFAHAEQNSELTALVSGDQKKLKELSKMYDVRHAVSYDDFDAVLDSGDVDAVYIALPNDMHHAASMQAIERGIHVLCEKPLALDTAECEEMITAARRHGVRLMTAYRLHFEQATLRAIELVQSGRIGEPRFFASSFAMQVRDEDNIRLSAERGGGPLYDLGVYCVNAVRSLFRDEPTEVLAMNATGEDDRFTETPEMTFAILRFPGGRMASFGCSFGAADVSVYDVVGTKGHLRVEPAYKYATGLAHRLRVNGRTTRVRYKKRDQFAPELLAFSDSILSGRDPEPSGEEGLADVRVIRAIMRSAATGRAVTLGPAPDVPHPDPDQERRRPPVRKPDLIHARSASGD